MNELGNTPADKDYKPSGISKAEQKAWERYPNNAGKYKTEFGTFSFGDTLFEHREGFIVGYEQAEKDLSWISVKDRLPDTTEYVFTCVEMQGGPQCVGFHYYKDGKWYEGYEEDTVGAVEYWMPIPNLPKK